MAIARISTSQTFQPDKVVVVPSARMSKVYTFLRVLIYSVVATIFLLYMFGGKAAIIGETTPLWIPSEGQHRQRFPTNARIKTSNMTARGGVIGEEQRKHFNKTNGGDILKDVTKQTENTSIGTRGNILKDVTTQIENMSVGKDGIIFKNGIKLKEDLQGDIGGKHFRNATKNTENMPVNIGGNKNAYQQSGNASTDSETATKHLENIPDNTKGNINRSTSKQGGNLSANVKEEHRENATEETKKKMSVDIEGNITKNVSRYEIFTQSKDAAPGNKTFYWVNRTNHPRIDTDEKTQVHNNLIPPAESSKCANRVEIIKHLEFIKAWNDIRDSQQHSAIKILRKLCSKCGVIIHVEFPINSTTPSCNIIIKGTITLILSAERECQHDMMSKTLLSYIEEELELELSPLSTIVLLNQSSAVGRQLLRISRACSHSIKQTSNVIIGYIQSEVTHSKPPNTAFTNDAKTSKGKVSYASFNNDGKTLMNSKEKVSHTSFTNDSKTLMNLKEKVSYMVYLYLGYTYCLHDSWNRSSPEKFNCFMPKNHPRFTVTNYSMEPHRFLFQRKALCGIDSGLLYRLQSMDAITSMKRSLGATLRIKMNKMAAKSGILARLLHDKWMIFEEIDGRIVELLHRYRVCNTIHYTIALFI